jgi:multimeric flavodoxin WrbA
VKYLFIQGSPRLNGNTATALKALIEGLEQEVKPENIEYLEANKLFITPCQACDSCKTNGGICVQEDETNWTIQKIWDSDFIILGTPVYYWGMSAQLKLILDKLYCRNDQFKRSQEKRIGLVVVGGNRLTDPQYSIIDVQVSCIADYLNWRHVFTNSYSAYKIGDLARSEEDLEDLKNLGAYLGHEHHH